MITITPQEILDYRHVIQKYSGYDRNINIFDDYITQGAVDLKRLLAGDGVDVDLPEVEADENMRQCYLSYVVYQFYFENSFNVESDRIMINELNKVYVSDYQLLLKSAKSQSSDISTVFVG